MGFRNCGTWAQQLLLLGSRAQFNICGGGDLGAKSHSTLVTPWAVAHQAPLTMGFSRQEYRSGLPFPSAGDLPDAGIKPTSLALQADSLPAEPQGKPLGIYGEWA